MKETLIFIIISLFITTSFSQDAETIINKYYESIGTRESWRKLESRIDKYETKRANIIPNEFSREIKYSNVLMLRVAKRKDKINLVRLIFVNEKSPFDTTTSSFNGTDYWIQINGGNASNPFYDIKEVTRNSILGHPDIFTQADSLIFIGTKQVDGKECNVIRVKIDRKESDYYFDSKMNYLIMYHPKDKFIKTKLNDYRDVQGLKIPFTEELSNEFGVISLNILSEIRLNIIIEDNYFSKLVGEGLTLE
jgi:3-phenylpropionate/cinnamic acid dioxygenase small subunit